FFKNYITLLRDTARNDIFHGYIALQHPMIRVRTREEPKMKDLLPPGGMIRKLWISERDLFREHLLRLDPRSRRHRFGGAVSDQFLREYSDLAFGIDSIMHGFFVNGTLRGAAELRPVGSPLKREAEAAFSIEHPWQSHGVGSLLLERTLLAARNRGLKYLHM